jgi:GDP-L-fucose synthase
MSNSSEKKKVLVTGASGFIGSSISVCLEDYFDVALSNHSECNLENYDETYSLLNKHKPCILVNAAGRVAGIQGNISNPSELLAINARIALNIAEAAERLNIEHVIQFASACVYPLNDRTASKTSDIGTGPIEETSKSYAMSKLLAIELFSAYRKQFGCQWITVIPSNLYGIGDWGHGANGHVVAMLVERFLAAKVNSDPYVEVWGDGKSYRNFLNVIDLAQCVKFIMKNNIWKNEIINVNGESEISIASLAKIIAKNVNYEGKIQFNASQPNGARRKKLDDTPIRDYGWSQEIDFEKGLKEYCAKYQFRF